MAGKPWVIYPMEMAVACHSVGKTGLASQWAEDQVRRQLEKEKEEDMNSQKLTALADLSASAIVPHSLTGGSEGQWYGFKPSKRQNKYSPLLGENAAPINRDREKARRVRQATRNETRSRKARGRRDLCHENLAFA